MVEMKNTSLEKFRVQVDSKVFSFKPNGSVMVPYDLVMEVYERTKDYGTCPIYKNMSDEEIAQTIREARLNYLNGVIRERLANFTAQADEFKKRGVTLPEDPLFTRTMRWKKELETLLNQDAPIVEELSFSSTKMADSEPKEVPEPKRLGRPKKIEAEV